MSKMRINETISADEVGMLEDILPEFNSQGKKQRVPLEKIEIVSFSVGKRTYKFKEPLMLESESAEGMLYLTRKEPTLSASGKSWRECENIIREELAMLWEEYALAPNDELTADAISLKNDLLAMVEEVK